MRRRWMRLVQFVCVLVLAAAPLTAQQEKPGPVLKEWGLVGTWAVRCDQPPSGSNSHLRYVVEESGAAFHLRDLGDQYERDRSEIQRAWIGAGGELYVVINFTSLSQVREVAFTKLAPNQKRATSNRQLGGAGAYSVQNGRFTSNGRETPVQTRCN